MDTERSQQSNLEEDCSHVSTRVVGRLENREYLHCQDCNLPYEKILTETPSGISSDYS